MSVNTSTVPANPNAPYNDSVDVYSLIISRPGGNEPIKIRTGGVNPAWAVSGSVTMSAEVRTRDLLEAFETFDLRAMWVFWTHPALGTWGGEIQECEPDSQTGTTEIGARDFSALLDASRLPKVYDSDNAAPAGAWVKRIMTDAKREGAAASWIGTIYADETGDQLRVPLRGGSIFDAFRTLENRSNDEWFIDSNLKLWWFKQRGADRTNRVLHDGVHIFNVRPSLSLGAIINDLRVVPADETYRQAETFVVDDDASIDRYGRRQGELLYTGMVTESTLRPVARRDLNRLKNLGGTVRFECVNVANCFTWFGDGDAIVLSVPSLNFRPRVRVLARTYDSESKRLTVSATIEEMTAT